MNPRYARVALRAWHRCEYCHAPEVVFNFPFEVEHIVPVLAGGSESEGNWALACRSCNLHKGAHVTGVDIESEAVVSLFDPRKHRWEDHFQVEMVTGKILGLTAVGRATIARLEMDSEAQITARKRWIQIGLFP
jgi:hypothetical protein